MFPYLMERLGRRDASCGVHCEASNFMRVGWEDQSVGIFGAERLDKLESEAGLPVT